MATKKTPLDDLGFTLSFIKDAIDHIATDMTKVKNGVAYDWLPFGTFMLSHAGNANAAYRAFIASEAQKIKGTIDDETSFAIMADAYARTVIVSLVKPDGTPVALNDEARTALAGLFKREDMRLEFEGLMAAASNIANYRKTKNEADAKNSVKS